MNLKSLILVVIPAIFLAGVCYLLIESISTKGKQNQASAQESPDLFLVCPECHLKLRMSPQLAQAGLPCPHCADKGVRMEKAGRFSGTSSGVHYDLQLFAVSLVGVDGILGLLFFYYYCLLPRLHSKCEKNTFFHC